MREHILRYCRWNLYTCGRWRNCATDTSTRPEVGHGRTNLREPRREAQHSSLHPTSSAKATRLDKHIDNTRNHTCSYSAWHRKTNGVTKLTSVWMSQQIKQISACGIFNCNTVQRSTVQYCTVHTIIPGAFFFWEVASECVGYEHSSFAFQVELLSSQVECLRQ